MKGAVSLGRPLGSKNSKTAPKAVKKNKRTPIQKKTCVSCPPEEASQSIKNFYVSYSKLHSDGRLPMCAECIRNKSYDKENDEIDLVAFKNILRQIDKPFITKAYEASIDQYNKTYGGKLVPDENKKKIIGYYFKNIQTLRQYVTLDWEQGLELEEKSNSQSNNSIVVNIEEGYTQKKTIQEENEVYSLDDSDFEVTQEILLLFGSNFKKYEYKAMWDKYNFLKKNYNEVTNLHIEALITYIKFKVKEEFSIVKGDVIEAEKWGKLAKDASDKAKINPSQLSKSDLQGGLNSFSELFQAVEQAVDIIPILPQFKYRPNDAIDFNIWCMINYLRDLEGKPLCEYEDVYKFYDERKLEYISQYGDPYGIFTDDTTEKNRENIKKFITLPDDYLELDIQEDDYIEEGIVDKNE